MDENAKNSVRIACVLLWYPLFTQPFIFREIQELKKELPCEIHTLYGKNLAHCSEEMRQKASEVFTNGIAALARVVATLFSHLLFHPKETVQIFRSFLGYKWPNFEIFGENLWALSMGFLLARRFEEDKIDVVYAPWPRGTTTCARVIFHLTGIPFVTTVRGDNLCPMDPDLPDKLNDCAIIRANNLADQKRIEAIVKGKTRLVYNGLTLPSRALPQHILSYSPEKRPLALMALGRFDVTKGFDILLQTLFLLRKKISVTLTLAGGGGVKMGLGKLEGELRRLTHELGLDDIVTYPGLISHTDLPRIFSEHDIFVAPCVIDKEGRRDGIPNTVIEAMSMALPVVTSDIHALPEVCVHKKTGLTCPQKDPQALCDALFWLSAHREEAAKMGEAAREHVKNLFDPQKNAQKLGRLLADAARKNGRG